MSATTTTVYVSITGLKANAWYLEPVFWYHAVPSMIQGKKAKGNIKAENKDIKGVHHTLSVWSSRKDMLAFLRSGDHLKAMKKFDDFATGKVYGYETELENIPSWEEARELWETKGRVVGKAAREKN